MKGIIQRLNDIWSDSDHEQGCQGREYTCSCGFDADTFETAKDAIVEIERLTAENNELRTGEYLVKVIEERERLRKALKALLDRDERNTCQHENTHRGGFLWEICDDCGAKWADDEGGKPQWDDPAEWVEARTILLGINKTAASEASQC